MQRESRTVTSAVPRSRFGVFPGNANGPFAGAFYKSSDGLEPSGSLESSALEAILARREASADGQKRKLSDRCGVARQAARAKRSLPPCGSRRRGVGCRPAARGADWCCDLAPFCLTTPLFLARSPRSMHGRRILRNGRADLCLLICARLWTCWRLSSCTDRLSSTRAVGVLTSGLLFCLGWVSVNSDRTLWSPTGTSRARPGSGHDALQASPLGCRRWRLA